MRALLGPVESMFLPVSMALVAEYHPEETMATALSILGVGQCVGLIGGATFQGFLADRLGWRPSLWILGIAGILVAIPTHFLLPTKKQASPAGGAQPSEPGPRDGESFREAFTQLLKMPSFIILAAAGGLTAIGVWILVNWLPLYFKESFGMSLASAGFFGTSFLNASAAGSQFLGGMLSDRVARRGPERRMLLQGILIFAAAPVMMAFLGTKSLWVIVAAITLNAAFRNAADINMQPLLCDLAGRKRFAIAFGITNMVNCLAGGAGVFIAGLLKSTWGLAGVFAGIVAILLLDALMLMGGYFFFLKKDLRLAAVRAQAEIPLPV
jgi:MFS family permease